MSLSHSVGGDPRAGREEGGGGGRHEEREVRDPGGCGMHVPPARILHHVGGETDRLRQLSSTDTGTARPRVWPTGEVATTLSWSVAMSSGVASVSIDTRAVIVL